MTAQETLADFVSRLEDVNILISSGVISDEEIQALGIAATQGARDHAEQAHLRSLEEVGARDYEENGRRHIPLALERKLRALHLSGESDSEGLRQEVVLQPKVGLGNDQSWKVVVGSVYDDVQCIVRQEMTFSILDGEEEIQIGTLRDTRWPNYLHLETANGSIPIRGDHVVMDEASGRIAGFVEGLHPDAAAILSLVDLIPVDQSVIDEASPKWVPLQAVTSA